MNYLNKRIRVIQTGNWKYRGVVCEEDDEFLWLQDEVNGTTVQIRRNNVLVLEVLEQ